MNFFMTYEDGAAAFTPFGVVRLIVLCAAAFTVLLILLNRQKKTVSARQLAFAGLAVAIAYLCSEIRLFRMPWGGSVTLLSMFFVSVVGYWFGPRMGFLAAFTYGILQFVQGGSTYILSFWQVAFDYLFAFTALGVSGFFSGASVKKNGLRNGYLAGALLRGLFHSIGGYLYWMEYMPDNFPKSLSAVYPVLYNYAYILAEAAITVIVISLPPVVQGLRTVNKMARGQ